jgi:hypothetical protein
VARAFAFKATRMELLTIVTLPLSAKEEGGCDEAAALWPITLIF